MHVTKEVADIVNAVFAMAEKFRYEYVTPELLLYIICKNQAFAQAFEECGGDIEKLKTDLRLYLDEYMDSGREGEKPEPSQGLAAVLQFAGRSAGYSGKPAIELPHLIHAFFELEESYAVYYMVSQGVAQPELLRELTVLAEETMTYTGRDSRRTQISESEEYDDMEDEESAEAGMRHERQKYFTCLNDETEFMNPLIGREEELERTMQVLCRKDKNNPLHIGEPGVGKTAITYGLARLINEDKVPEPLKGARIYSLDLGGLLAGTQYRGEFEKRFKKVMDSICREDKPIIYIDEIHNIIGAGAVNGGSFDISNMLKPYLASGHVRFIGATTYEEYKKHFEKSKSMVRRFQNIDIKEPGISESIMILEGLKKSYEKFHGVRYGDGVLEHAVRMSDKYMNERFLPDKAIDLMDEAGAYRRMHPLNRKVQKVSKELIDDILSRTCKIPKQVVESDETEKLATLKSRLLKRIYGQDEAVSQVVNAVKFSRAGLSEEDKPLASLLFVGPTGVGKTEIAKTLALELGIKLIRFDMSEYEEKHAVSKLIGAPAGYVGYEEGGLLTEEVRKNPHAVLLLDEIEKAHPDIYNILLQVMDYASLTDNQGRKADFRNIIVIMTSNAGASRIGKPGIGFLGQDVKADIIMEEVKRIFQPEFRNRLNRIVVFHSIDEKMAMQIIDKKIGELKKMLVKKQVELTVDSKARDLLKKKGISTEFGAREIDRIIRSEIKPLLVDELLFGKLKKGGICSISASKETFILKTAQGLDIA